MANHLAAFERRQVDDAGLRRAAVAIAVIANAAGDAAFVLTRRAHRLRAHGGQFALPGGSVDAGETTEVAALRELEEEVGLPRSDARVLGMLDDYPTRSGFIITPVVTWISGVRPLVPNEAEVAWASAIPLAELVRSDAPQLRRIPESERPVISMPLAGTSVHAPTAAILYQLREVALLGRATRVHHFEQPVFAWK
jgi:8-oxo-dGTP pyrophosphatase MutT (NUDIX family)